MSIYDRDVLPWESDAGDWVRLNASVVGLDVKTLNGIIHDYITKDFTLTAKDADMRIAIGQAYLDIVNEFVPLKHGPLRGQSYVTKDGRVVWSVSEGFDFNYAMVQYLGGRTGPNGEWIEFKHYTTPGTGPAWDTRMGAIEMLSLRKRIRELIVRRMNGG